MQSLPLDSMLLTILTLLYSTQGDSHGVTSIHLLRIRLWHVSFVTFLTVSDLIRSQFLDFILHSPSFGTKVRAALLIWCSGGVVGGRQKFWSCVLLLLLLLSLLGAGMGACPVPQECHLDFYLYHLGFLIWGTTLDFEEWMKRLKKQLIMDRFRRAAGGRLGASWYWWCR